MSFDIPTQIEIVRQQADSALPRSRTILLSVIDTLESYARLKMTAAESLETRRINDEKLNFALNKSHQP